MNFKTNNKIDPSFSMSSMTDIVFLLLVFFILSANVIKGIDLVLPQAKGNSVSTKKISISISEENQYFIDNEKIAVEQLEYKITEALKYIDKPVIILRAAENVALQYVVNVMDIANQNSYKVVLAVRER